MDMEIRIKETGAVVTEQEFRAMHSRNVSFTETITADQIDGLGADPVLEAPAPPVTATQTAYRNGVALVEKNGRSWYEQAWAVRELTPDEIEARNGTRHKEILNQIDALERSAMLNRGSRELELRLMEKEATEQAALLSTPEAPVTRDMVLAQVPYYVRVKALDDQIAELRWQL